jgi:Domain of unknown function (DUF4352)
VTWGGDAPTRPIPQWEGPRQRGWSGWAGRRKVLTVLVAVLGVLVLGAVLGSLDQARSDARTSSGSDPAAADAAAAVAAPEPAEEPAGPGIGDPVRDGRFEFVVVGVRGPVPSLGTEPWIHRAHGEFVLVDVAVRNIGDEPQVFTDSAQQAYAGEARLDADGWAGRLLGDNAVGWETVNPGNELRGTLVYDVPPGTELTELDLHDSWFSGGVRVRLG